MERDMVASKKRMEALEKISAKAKKKAAKNSPNRKVYRNFTLDEFDEFTLEIRADGAHEERGSIIAELERKAKQLWEFSQAAELVPDRDIFAQRAAGLEMAARIISYLPKYEDNIGCPECEAF
jgi:hypothetical protein